MGRKGNLRKARKRIEEDAFVDRMQSLADIGAFLEEEQTKMLDAAGTFWNGMPTQAVRGSAVVAPSSEFPEYWAKELIGQRIEVVRVDLDGVNYGGGVSYLENQDGEGWRKVTEGHGSPSYPHKDLAIEEGSFIIDTSLEN